MSSSLHGVTARIRDLRMDDMEDVVRIDADHTGRPDPRYWKDRFDDFFAQRTDFPRVGLAAVDGHAVIGYLLGEVRAFEFGSDRCGWIFAIGVARDALRGGVATSLLHEACRRFREAGVGTVRTMVRREDVPVLSFFRSIGFVGGPFVQMEIDLSEVRT